MKKFSWIFALILALSIGFIGCPAGGDDDDGGGGGGGTTGGGGGFVPNPDVTAISVTFGTGADQTEVLFEKADLTKVGTVTYDNGSYTYEYATVTDSGYGNAIGRFKVDLGDARLGDFGGVSFKWKGISGDVGLSSGNITYTKNLFVLATDDEESLIPYQGDASIKGNIVNTDYFTLPGNASKAFYEGDIDVPHVKGLEGYPENQKPAGVTEPYPIATPIKLQKTLTGEVWFSIYFHSEGGSYSVSEFKLVPVASFTQIDPPAAPVAPPPAPANIPSDFVAIELDLTAYMTTADAVSTVVPGVTVDGDAITVAFTTNNQRINIPLSTEQKELYYTNVDAEDVYVQIDCETESTDNFRYHLGIVNSTASWNATNSLGDFPLLIWKGEPGGVAVSDTGKGIKVTDGGKSDDSKARADYFIFQYRGQTGATVKINSITLWVAPAPKAPTVNIDPTTITLSNNATITQLAGGNGIKVVTTQGYAWAWIYFKVTLPAGAKVADYTNMNYTIKSITVDPPLDDGGGYKAGIILGFDTLAEITAIINDTTANAQELDPTKTHAGGDKAKAHQLATANAAAGIQNPDTDLARAIKINTKAAPDGQTDTSVGLDQNGTEFYILFSCGGSAGYTYELKDIKFVAE